MGESRSTMGFMTLRCPTLSRTAIVTDDEFLAARLSCAFAQRGVYLPVLDGPRMTRPDHRAETTHRRNALARMKTKRLLVGGLPADAQAAMLAGLPDGFARIVEDADIGHSIAGPAVRTPLRWGRDRIGTGLLTALYEQRMIEFGDEPSPPISVKPRSSHLVVCEAGEPLSEVIAANYAFALGAGLHLIAETDESECTELLEAYYSIGETEMSPADTRARLKARLREMCGGVDLPRDGSLTFISRRLPFGVAFPELPSTHLFTYPDLGMATANGFAAEQAGTRGTNIAVLVNPEKTPAPEMDAAAKMLPERRVFVRGYNGPGASVRNVSDMVELFPYDLLVFATHCGDAPGQRETFEYRDSEGHDRTLVVDTALGFAGTHDPDRVKVNQFMRFHSLDGVDWTDRAAKAELYVGTAIKDFCDRSKEHPMKPKTREPLQRVVGSAALMMADNLYLAHTHSVAAMGTPIIINNACVSWHDLAGRFFFAGARAYIGTLFPVGTSEAEGIVLALLGKHFGKALPHAIWTAQNALYGALGDRRPYVVTGVYTQRLRVTTEDAPLRILTQLNRGERAWKQTIRIDTDDEQDRRKNEAVQAYYGREIPAFRDRWFPGGLRR